MIAKLANYFKGIPAVFLDGLIYVLLALFTFLQTQFAGDEAAKYITPQTLFWTKLTIGSFATIALALKLFRSTSYADHQKTKTDTGSWKIEPPATPPAQPKTDQ